MKYLSQKKHTYQWPRPLFHIHPTVSLEWNNKLYNFWPLLRGKADDILKEALVTTEKGNVELFLNCQWVPLDIEGNLLEPRLHRQNKQCEADTFPEMFRGLEIWTTCCFSRNF